MTMGEVPILETLCISKTPQPMDDVQHNIYTQQPTATTLIQ